MVRHKKDIIAFLIVVMLSSTIPVCRAQSTTDGTTKSQLDDSHFLFTNDPNSSTAATKNLGSQELFYKMMLAVLLVVVLGITAIYISKKFMPGISRLSGKKIRISETVHLGQHRAVHLLKIGGRRLLIGSTNNSITSLADVTDALAETDLSSKEINGK